jgi:hypothetical protein
MTIVIFIQEELSTNVYKNLEFKSLLLGVGAVGRGAAEGAIRIIRRSKRRAISSTMKG